MDTQVIKKIRTPLTSSSTPDILEEAMDIAYVQSRKQAHSPRISWKSIRSNHV